MENAFYELNVPVERIWIAEIPLPYAHHLEQLACLKARSRWARKSERD